jgi:SAM-dependent methyltransferase
MSHWQQVEYCKGVKEKFPLYFTGINVLDVGSLDLNGNNKGLFNNCRYIGIDIAEGKNVDFVSIGHEYPGKDEEFTTIISTECFEHDQYLEKTLKNIVRMLKSKGLFMFTCATTGRPEHGTLKQDGPSSPLTLKIEGWNNYYKNLLKEDIMKLINIDEIFEKYEFTYEDVNHDLRFWGIKK